MDLLPVAQVRSRYLILISLRWLAVGLVIPVQALLPLARGLSLAQLGVVMAIQGFVVLALELPTGGLTDAWGRRPVLVLAGVIGVAATSLYFVADSVASFAVASALMGVFRALDSGPLEAWFVDATQATVPDYPLERGLSAGNAALSIAIAAGSALALPLVSWQPFDGVEPLALPVAAALVVQIVLIPLTLVLMREIRPAGERPGVWSGIREVPRVIGGGVALLRRSRVVLALVSVELFWSFGMPAFESLTPVRLSELFDGDADRAAAVIGPAGAAAWAAAAAGSAVALLMTRWWGVARSAVLLRLVQGATVVTMGLIGGVVGLLTAFFACYLVHGASNALHSTLLHRQVGPDHRATVVSLNSMVSQPAASVGVLVLTAVADRTGDTSWSFVIAGVVIAIAAPLYLPAWRAERETAPAAVAQGASGPT
ncbi:MFS transporter [Nakamurella deserti]|uniref:MFS transporter n=1 Tax=Nakamurella deserti TaxID=2164074 RepID=UPI0013007400|nr:MFS transporter [Nakamurella deserti]